jgi:hypothetical protein
VGADDDVVPNGIAILGVRESDLPEIVGDAKDNLPRPVPMRVSTFHSCEMRLGWVLLYSEVEVSLRAPLQEVRS